MIPLGTVSLFRANGQQVQAVVEKRTFDQKDRVDFTYQINVAGSNKEYGLLQFSTDSQNLLITCLHNYTHEKKKDKVHMGAIFDECMVAQFYMSHSEKLFVYATGSYWFYMSQGFELVKGSSSWRFKQAEEIHLLLSSGLELTQPLREIYEREKANMAEAIGVLEEKLSFEEVCKCEDPCKELRRIFEHARSQNRSMPSLVYSNHILMQMSEHGLEKGKNRILTSKLRHDLDLIDRLQTEVLGEIHAHEGMLPKVKNLIIEYADKPLSVRQRISAFIWNRFAACCAKS
jgi:hypothetical protein